MQFMGKFFKKFSSIQWKIRQIAKNLDLKMVDKAGENRYLFQLDYNVVKKMVKKPCQGKLLSAIWLVNQFSSDSHLLRDSEYWNYRVNIFINFFLNLRTKSCFFFIFLTIYFKKRFTPHVFVYLLGLSQAKEFFMFCGFFRHEIFAKRQRIMAAYHQSFKEQGS